MEFLILVFFTSFIVVLLSTPALIKVAILKRLVDTPSEDRKIHSKIVPTIGGIIIFVSFQTEVLMILGRNNTDSDGDITANIESMSNISTDASNLERLN